MSQDDDDHLHDCVDDDCWQCGGRAWIANCFEEFACIDPDEGCARIASAIYALPSPPNQEKQT